MAPYKQNEETLDVVNAKLLLRYFNLNDELDALYDKRLKIANHDSFFLKLIYFSSQVKIDNHAFNEIEAELKKIEALFDRLELKGPFSHVTRSLMCKYPSFYQ